MHILYWRLKINVQFNEGNFWSNFLRSSLFPLKRNLGISTLTATLGKSHALFKNYLGSFLEAVRVSNFKIRLCSFDEFASARPQLFPCTAPLFEWKPAVITKGDIALWKRQCVTLYSTAVHLMVSSTLHSSTSDAHLHWLLNLKYESKQEKETNICTMAVDVTICYGFLKAKSSLILYVNTWFLDRLYYFVLIYNQKSSKLDSVTSATYPLQAPKCIKVKRQGSSRPDLPRFNQAVSKYLKQ